MFRHCVMIRWTDDSTEQQRSAARDAASALPSLIPEIRAYPVGFDANLAETNFDMVAVGGFDDAAAYEVHANHPEHLRVLRDHLRPITAQRAAAHYEF
jgi:hypothetical protein